MELFLCYLSEIWHANKGLMLKHNKANQMTNLILTFFISLTISSVNFYNSMLSELMITKVFIVSVDLQL